MPEELTRRARTFVACHGHRLYTGMSDSVLAHWSTHGIPTAVVERMAAFEARWGGLLLPPAPRYEGGPKVLQSDLPEISPDGRWSFEAGDQRFSMAYSFSIGPDDEFGIENGTQRVVLHSSIAGWIESVALAYEVQLRAPRLAVVPGRAVDDIELSAMKPFTEVAGVSDSWWRGEDTVAAIYCGEALLFGRPDLQSATVYTGISQPDINLAP